MLKKIINFIVIYMALNVLLFVFWFCFLPEKRHTVTQFKDELKIGSEKIAIIGCSNLDHNIDFTQLRDSINAQIDFYVFNGSAPFNYLKFLFDNKYIDTSDYNRVVLYLPNTLYDGSRTFQHRWGFYEIFASQEYIIYLIRSYPEFLLRESWLFNFFDVFKKRKILISDSCVLSISSKARSEYIDSLIKNSTDYLFLNKTFDKSKFVEEWSPDLVNQWKFGTNVYILLPPLADIRENEEMSFENKRNNNILSGDNSFFYDSTFFFDQWYHLNNFGRQLETSKLIEGLKSSGLDFRNDSAKGSVD